MMKEKATTIGGRGELLRVWMNALEKTARDFHGTRPKRFCRRVYEHAVEELFKIMGEYGLSVSKASTLRESVERYVEASVQAGLLEDVSQVQITEINVNNLDIRVNHSPFAGSCRDLLESGLTLKELTCAQMGCFRGAVLLLSDVDCQYDLIAFDPVKGCQG